MNNPASTPLLFAYSIIYFLVLLIEISKVNANFAGLCYCGVFKIFCCCTSRYITCLLFPKMGFEFLMHVLSFSHAGGIVVSGNQEES